MGHAEDAWQLVEAWEWSSDTSALRSQLEGHVRSARSWRTVAGSGLNWVSRATTLLEELALCAKDDLSVTEWAVAYALVNDGTSPSRAVELARLIPH